MQNIQVLDRHFEILIPAEKIQERIKAMAAELKQDYNGKEPLFIAVLNGAFMFAGSLFKELDFPCTISFVKVASYEGVATTGKIQVLAGINEPLKDRHVIILEDILDTGLTLSYIQRMINEEAPASVSICTLLQKPDALKVAVHPKYVGFKVENRFLVGYGLDYNGFGRNSGHVYAELNTSGS